MRVRAASGRAPTQDIGVWVAIYPDIWYNLQDMMIGKRKVFWRHSAHIENRKAHVVSSLAVAAFLAGCLAVTACTDGSTKSASPKPAVTAAVPSAASSIATIAAPPAVQASNIQRMVYLDFQCTSMCTVLLWLADMTGCDKVTLDPGVQQQVTIVQPQPIPVAEAQKIVFSILDQMGFTATRRGTELIVVKSASGGMQKLRRGRGPLRPPPGTNAPPVGSQETKAIYRLQFDNVDVVEVVKRLAEITGETFLPDPRLSGKVTIINPKPVTRIEARQIILSALEMQGFTIVQSGTVTKIIPSAKGTQAPIPTETGQGSTSTQEQ